MRRALALVLLASTVALPTWAAAKRRVAVLDLVTDGVAGDVKNQFEASIEEHLRKLGYQVIPRSAVAELQAKRDELVEGCAFGPCVAAVAQALGADKLLAVRISAEGPSYSFVVSMVEPTYGSTVAQEAATCGVCTVAEALTKMGGALASLENQRVVPREDATGRIVKMQPPRRSKLLPILLVVSGLALGGGGAVVVTQTTTKDPGWVALGSGGTVLLTGLIMLLAGD